MSGTQRVRSSTGGGTAVFVPAAGGHRLGVKKLPLVLGVLALVVPASMADSPSPRVLPWWTQRACHVEDAVNCYWDAGAGNGAGHSFIVRRFPDGGPVCLMYVERRYARHHDRCVD